MAKKSFLHLLGYYFLFCFVVSILFGSIYYFNHLEPKYSYLEHVYIAIFQLFGTDIYDISYDSIDGINLFVFFINKAFAVLLPGIILGTIIFKLLIHRNVLIFKNKMNLYYDENKNSFMLCIRFYSSTKLHLTNLEFSVIARLKRVREDTKAPYLVNYNLACNKTWEFASTNVPKTINIKLHEKDVKSYDGTKEYSLLSIQGKKCQPTDELWVIVTGNVPELGNSFTEKKTYVIGSDIIQSKWEDVHVEYGKKPVKWIGWNKFEN